MTIRFINITVGQKLSNGQYSTAHLSHSLSQMGQVSIVFDDTVILNLNQLKSAFAEALTSAAGNSEFAKG